MSTRNIDTRQLTRARAGRWWALAAIVVSGLVVGLDSTVLFTALPTLSAKLGASTTDLQWISAAYTLALGGFLLIGGVLGDHYGRRRMLLVGLLIFGVASVIASQMTTALGLIWLRAVMGIGAAFIIPLGLSILPSMFSEEERPRAVAATAAGAFLGLPLGPLIAGFLLTHYAWGTIFLINAPVVVIALLGVWFLVPESKDPDPQRIDWVGATLSAAGVTALVYGVIEQPVNGWTSAPVLAGLIGGVIVLLAFVAWDLRHRDPFVDMRLFRNPRFTWATIAFMVTGFALFGVLFILTPYLQIVQGNDAQLTGIKLLPMIGAVIVGAGLGNRIAARLGARIGIPAGLAITTIGVVILSRAGADTGYALVAVALAIAGLGLGTALPTALDTVLSTLPPAQTGVGSALTRTLQQVSASFGVAILGSILTTAYRNSLAPRLSGLPTVVRDAAQGSVAGASAVASHLPPALAGPLVHAAHVAYADGMDQVMLISAGVLLAASIVIGAFMPQRSSVVD
jgi:MFS transporter, DHA2 family, multidrug resistance protein